MTDNSGLASPGDDIGDSDLDEFRALVRAAFEQALNGGKPDWRQMTSAVLKNRLLNLTQGQFTENRYGSPSFIHLVRRVPDLIEVITDKPPFGLQIKDSDDQGITPSSAETPASPLSDDNYPTLTESDWRKARIRRDLWRAMLHYGHSESYVIDPKTGNARLRAEGENELPEIPTISRDEATAWRQEFIASLEPSVSERSETLLNEWANGSGKWSDLPNPVRGLWTEFVKRRISTLLLDWFRNLGQAPPADLIQLPQGRSTPPPQEISEIVRTRQLKDYVIRAVRGMTYEELAQIQLPASVLLRISERLASQDD